jgi:hypothetical protein
VRQKFFLNRRFWSFQGSYSKKADSWPLLEAFAVRIDVLEKSYVLSKLQRVLRRPLEITRVSGNWFKGPKRIYRSGS